MKRQSRRDGHGPLFLLTRLFLAMNILFWTWFVEGLFEGLQRFYTFRELTGKFIVIKELYSALTHQLFLQYPLLGFFIHNRPKYLHHAIVFEFVQHCFTQPYSIGQEVLERLNFVIANVLVVFYINFAWVLQNCKSSVDEDILIHASWTELAVMIFSVLHTKTEWKYSTFIVP